MLSTYAATQETNSIYIHVPFCRSKCPYCDFYSVADSDSEMQKWHTAILTEMRLNYQSARDGNFNTGSLQTIYYGGGTPSTVPPSLYAEQIASLEDLFGIAENAEITLEANPGVFSSLSSYRSVGFNRISFGLQSASDKLQQIIGRSTTTEAFINDILAAEKAGFNKICADIMLGLPGQNLQDVNDTLDLIISLPIGHVSYYSLTLSEGTPFWRRYANMPELLPDEDIERKMYDLTMGKLTDEGIIPYEICNAARRGEESRHNRVYWRADSYMGLGPSAHSYLGGIRYGNPSSLQKWYQRISKLDPAAGVDGVNEFGSAAGAACDNKLYPAACVNEFGSAAGAAGLPGSIEEIIVEDAARAETVMLGLRLLRGVEFDNFYRRHKADLRQLYAQQIARLAERGLIEQDYTAIRLTRLGLDLANQVFMEFI